MRTGNTYRDVWTLRPGTQTLNLWGYRVFRYAEVIGADPEEIKATALVYPYDPAASSWSSSNADLNRVVDFNREGVRELNLDLHLDSPSRERAPYEGDNLIHMLIQGYTDGDWTLSQVHAAVARGERDVADRVAVQQHPLRLRVLAGDRATSSPSPTTTRI